MDTIVRERVDAPDKAGWFYGRHQEQPHWPIEPHRVLKFANGLGVPNGTGFTDVLEFHWFGPVPPVHVKQ